MSDLQINIEGSLHPVDYDTHNVDRHKVGDLPDLSDRGAVWEDTCQGAATNDEGWSLYWWRVIATQPGQPDHWLYIICEDGTPETVAVTDGDTIEFGGIRLWLF